MNKRNNTSTTTLAYAYAKAYERATTKRDREAVIREAQRKIRDARVSEANRRMLRHIVNFHARKVKGVSGHRPTVHTMYWS